MYLMLIGAIGLIYVFIRLFTFTALAALIGFAYLAEAAFSNPGHPDPTAPTLVAYLLVAGFVVDVLYKLVSLFSARKRP